MPSVSYNFLVSQTLCDDCLVSVIANDYLEEQEIREKADRVIGASRCKCELVAIPFCLASFSSNEITLRKDNSTKVGRQNVQFVHIYTTPPADQKRKLLAPSSSFSLSWTIILTPLQ